ncbi:hypothetical protein HRR83_009582 [Exophiala dermatitidis]|uniref:Zn(2)-C6 fungal-type domain-containing protein n=2 Tax=Exophiala dermatitidis TaxID=5970 RepID=H6BTJ0_EXODN|nr:uncharacterized protein HMPREF1120_03554 [Exophiala dermatitidis NIH/UT8656]KAJ4502177.1 hypothetical protein HRR73_009549 [Exophiala dermatitidis]EHY55417.1 hypothetical protein HMPREF1120_03554 [Exophiala dermatitidis NIH/UT8656]KAJ4502422.1 hypothetical protein HRR74_009582 [Exophiala dermatitidis]KAJ4530299.1 hypothetical protein HRR77_009549 [Exophiala dermatitidis]KAJ4540309.1 hypothetical protein HRR76_003717 [Exophiala dermatitidis]
MSKRSWQEANMPSPRPAPSLQRAASSASPHSFTSPTQSTSPRKIRNSFDEPPLLAKGPPKPQRTNSTNGNTGESTKLPGISRKVKACAACRKQKIKCIMHGDPPCQRCKERGLSCRLNKSLQTLMSEDSKWKAAVTKDVTALYSAVEEIVRTLQLPALPQMLTSTQDPAIFFDQDENNDQDDDEQSPDNSPKVTPVADNLSHVPIESLYQITGMRSLRATENLTDDQSRICKQLRDTDFIARGIIKQEDAEYLANYYLSKLDPYIWHMCPDYKDLESFRRRSPTLTACILTVAALHDTKLGHLYSICSKEYRRLVANAMFERKIDMEYLRALVLGSYWLSDISWTLSGYAIRRASEFQLRRFYQDITDSIRIPGKVDQGRLQEAIDGIRVLYALYICDHHLSILYGRSSIMRDNESYITGWEAYLACSLSTDADRRIAGQICLMYLMNQIRETLGPEDTNSVLPDSALSKIAGFERDLDDWIARFSRHNPSHYIGNWPNKGAVMHYHWAKLYLQSYVLRGLPENGAIIPDHFLENASAAVFAATAIINLLLEDKDGQQAIAYVPHHIHGMIAFASMFLLKVATKHSEQLFVDKARFQKLIGALAQQFKATDVGKDHLIHRMAEGLEKMAETLGGPPRPKDRKINGLRPDQSLASPSQPTETDTPERTTNGQTAGPDYNSLDPTAFDFGDPAMGLGMPFFDFEGTTLDTGENMWNFAQ